MVTSCKLLRKAIFANERYNKFFRKVKNIKKLVKQPTIY